MEADAMAMIWADEVSNDEPPPELEQELERLQPLPELEPLYILAAIELGDPDQKGWIMNQAVRFYDLFRQWHEGKKQPCEPAEALLQYILWYKRESRKVKTHS